MAERFVADENFPGAIVRFLRERGDQVLYVAEELVGAADDVILQRALASDSVILTFDQDFGELVYRRRLPTAGVVLFRVKDQAPDVVIPFLTAFFQAAPALRGYFTVANLRHVRQRPVLRLVDDPPPTRPHEG